MNREEGMTNERGLEQALLVLPRRARRDRRTMLFVVVTGERE